MVAAALSQPVIPMETPSSATVGVSALPTTTATTSGGGGAARKRRRQILLSQRRKAADESTQEKPQMNPETTDPVSSEPPPKKQCVVAPTTMVKVEAAAVVPLPDVSTSSSVTNVKLNPNVGVTSKTSHPASVPILSPSLVLSAPRKISDASASPTLSPRSRTDGVASPDNSTDEPLSRKTSKPKPKRPQMRYEPDVPMTKQEAAVWRREQRRKRNRESAAASRQRQRDRITELEEEVDDWKKKFQAAMQRLAALERAHGASPTHDSSPPSALVTSSVSPCPSPHFANAMDFQDFTEKDLLGPALTKEIGVKNMNIRNETHPSLNMELHLKEKISRPAVKITGADPNSNPKPSFRACSPPSPILSGSPDPSTSDASIAQISVQEVTPAPVSPGARDDSSAIDNDELEFDQFLRDAAEWL